MTEPKRITFSLTDISDVHSIIVSTGHDMQSAMAVIEAETLGGAHIGSEIEIWVGYDNSNSLIFKGYIKQLDNNVSPDVYTITCFDYMSRAVDYFIAPENPEEPYSRHAIMTEDLVGELMAMAGLVDYVADETSFELAHEGNVEVVNVSVYDFCKQLASIITWSLWADSSGVIHFENRKPYVMYGTSGQLGDTPDDPTSYEWLDTNLIDSTHTITEKDLRNKVIVYGNGVNGVASEESPWLPAGFYKTVVIGAATLLNTQEGVDLAAQYNLALLHRLTETLSITVVGDSSLNCRTVITIDSLLLGIVDTPWYVYSCEHNISSAGYTTLLELRQ